MKNIVGTVDGQTTNPTLIAKNPEVERLVSSGRKFNSKEEREEYKKIVQAISPLVGDAGVSIAVFADLDTTAEQMFAQGQEMFSWIPNAYVKYPCTHEGLRAAQMSVRRNIRVNMTLCFSQEQAAAETEMRQRASRVVDNDAAIVNDFLEFGGCFASSIGGYIGAVDQVKRITGMRLRFTLSVLYSMTEAKNARDFD